MAEEKPEAKEIVEELRVTRTLERVWVEPGVSRERYMITFWSDRIPPQTIYIWKDEYSEEKERELIAQKIKEYYQSSKPSMKVRIKLE